MSVLIKQKPIGRDLPIQNFQQYVYGQIKKVWGLTDANFDLYGRAYRNQKTENYVPEVFDGTHGYTEVLFDDTKTATGFFHLSDIVVNNLAKCRLIIMINLVEEIYKTPDKRDEQLHVDLQKICNMQRFGFQMEGLVTGIDNVFEEYDRDSVRFRDEWPAHCFGINFRFAYNFFDCQ